MKHKNRQERTEAKKRVAESLGVSISTVNRNKLVENGLESVENVKKSSETAEKRRKQLKEYAFLVDNRKMRLIEAAHRCGISERQMRRHIAKLGIGEEV